MEEREIKAVEMVREIRDDLYRKTAGMTNEELIQFFRDGAQPTRQRLERLPAQNRRAGTFTS